MALTRTYHKHDDYWKLIDYSDKMTAKRMREELAHRRFHVGKWMDKTLLADALYRSDLGHMSYNDLDKPTLKRFVSARGLLGEVFGLGSCSDHRHNHILLLERADLALKFPNFTRLPSELRLQVYEFYFSDFRQPIIAPSQPPISKVSRLLRTESLPLFYQICSFEVRLMATVYPSFRLDMTAAQHDFLYATPDRLLGQISGLVFIEEWHGATTKICTVKKKTEGANSAWTFEAGSSLALSGVEMPFTEVTLRDEVLNPNGEGSALTRDGVFRLRKAIEERMETGSSADIPQ